MACPFQICYNFLLHYVWLLLRFVGSCSFLVQGEDNDNDKYHVAYSWVVVKLRDINDNKPQFERPNIEVSVYENAEVGKSLETFKATDPDQGGKSKVKYAIDRTSDRKRQFSISEEGTVSIQRNLDREETPRHQVSCCCYWYVPSILYFGSKEYIKGNFILILTRLWHSN